jgi:hypothetical protein
MIDEFNPGLNMVWNVCFGHFNAPIWILGCHPVPPQMKFLWIDMYSWRRTRISGSPGSPSQDVLGRTELMAFHKPGGIEEFHGIPIPT